jgi:hypothetical protein
MIRSRPLIEAEHFDIYDGCNQPGSNFDVPTTQTISNGIVLFYTPNISSTSPMRRKRKRTLEEEAGHRSLGGTLDMPPVLPRIIFTHGTLQLR